MSMIPSNFEINVARASADGHLWHYYRIELGHTIDQPLAIERFAELCERFPADEGFDLQLRRVECYGSAVAERPATPAKEPTR